MGHKPAYEIYKGSKDVAIHAAIDGALQTRVFFQLSRTSIRVACDTVPWECPPGSEYIIETSMQDRVSLRRSLTKTDEGYYRTIIWGVMHFAESQMVPLQDLFRSTNAGSSKTFTIVPPTDTVVPLQRLHVGTGVIPNALADIPSELFSTQGVLDKLNDVLGTAHTLDTPGIRSCIEYALSHAHDFGKVYGMLRSWWSEDFVTALSSIKASRAALQARRDKAIQGLSIQDSAIPPRRVWDLHSNRVLPFHVVRWDTLQGPDALPDNLWPVSHSWVEPHERVYVRTPINGRRWPVPIPRDTSLEHVRIELLNMGAEYVWLDVLCLRQESEGEDGTRLEEWKLDVPTIGHIYQAYPLDRPCITYFNGLGLPLDTSPRVLKSDRHWFNRVWTVQETLRAWLPGGCTAASSPHMPQLVSRVDELVQKTRGVGVWDVSSALVQALKARRCTNELDRVAGLAYCLRSSTLPLYDPSEPLESAWSLLIKHADGRVRTNIFFMYEADTPFGLWVSWAGFLTNSPVLQWSFQMFEIHPSARLKLVDPMQLYTGEPGQYFHVIYTVGPCYIVPPPENDRDDQSELLHLQMHETTGSSIIAVHAPGRHGCLLPGVAYHLLGIGKFWAVVEVVGERDVQGESALEAIKWGAIRVRKEGRKSLIAPETGGRKMRVVYLGSEEAQARSKHTQEYLEAFEATRSRRLTPNCIVSKQ